MTRRKKRFAKENPPIVTSYQKTVDWSFCSYHLDGVNMRFVIATIGIAALLSFTYVQAEEKYFDCKRITRWTDCIAVPLASKEEDKDSKSFSRPANEVARIYIVRPYTHEPKAKSEVYVDGKFIGVLGPLTFLSLELLPGRHTVMVRTGHATVVEVEARSQQNLFLQYQLNQWLGRITGETKVLSDEAGQAKVRKANRAMNVVSTVRFVSSIQQTFSSWAGPTFAQQLE